MHESLRQLEISTRKVAPCKMAAEILPAVRTTTTG
jgi:hypothetical protein